MHPATTCLVVLSTVCRITVLLIVSNILPLSHPLQGTKRNNQGTVSCNIYLNAKETCG